MLPLLLLTTLAHADIAPPCWEGLRAVPTPGVGLVPTNTVLRAVDLSDCDTSLTLSLQRETDDAVVIAGERAADSGWVTFPDAVLEPDTMYTAFFGNGEGNELWVEFLTAAGPAGPVELVRAELGRVEAFGQRRGDVVVEHTVFVELSDLGRGTSVRFEHDDGDVQEVPAFEASQLVFQTTIPSPEDLGCFTVEAVAPDLTRSAPLRLCPDIDDVEFQPYRGCSTLPVGGTLPLWLAVPLLWLRRRR